MKTEEQIVITKRPRRNRKSQAIRDLVQETHLQINQLVAPLFIIEGVKQRQPIPSMPEIFRFSIDLLLEEIRQLSEMGIKSIALFPAIDANLKDGFGSEAIKQNNLCQRAVDAIKNRFPEICVIVDIALDPYTDHGHDGITDDFGNVLNDTTLLQLGAMACGLAQVGADIVAPSDMMDGRIGYIRAVLDQEGFEDVGILSYAAKYASSLYGPFREALHSGLKKGDKKAYQMNPANVREALLESFLDEQEGADMLLIKPALSYLDVIAKVRQKTNLPLGAYHVSGEYSMVMAAAKQGWIDADKVFAEHLLSIRRAGADFIFTYAASRIARLLTQCY